MVWSLSQPIKPCDCFQLVHLLSKNRQVVDLRNDLRYELAGAFPPGGERPTT